MTENMMMAITAINKWMFFSWNYASIEYEMTIGCRTEIVIIPEFLARVNWTCNINHMIEKWSKCCQTTNAFGYLSKFYAELDSENSRLLIEWVMKNYNGEKKIL